MMTNTQEAFIAGLAAGFLVTILICILSIAIKNGK